MRNTPSPLHITRKTQFKQLALTYIKQKNGRQCASFSRNSVSKNINKLASSIMSASPAEKMRTGTSLACVCETNIRLQKEVIIIMHLVNPMVSRENKTLQPISKKFSNFRPCSLVGEAISLRLTDKKIIFLGRKAFVHLLRPYYTNDKYKLVRPLTCMTLLKINGRDVCFDTSEPKPRGCPSITAPNLINNPFVSIIIRLTRK